MPTGRGLPRGPGSGSRPQVAAVSHLDPAIRPGPLCSPHRPRSKEEPAMPRVAEKGGFMVRAAQRYSKRKYGREITVTPVIAHSRPNMIGWGALEWFQERASRVDERLK